MTEQGWWENEDPSAMLESLRYIALASERKLQLFSCWSLRRLYQVLSNLNAARLINSMYADGIRERLQEYRPDFLQTVEERADDGSNSNDTPRFINLIRRAVNRQFLIGVSKYRFLEFTQEVSGWTLAMIETYSSLESKERVASCTILRDMVGYPFRGPVTFHPHWLTSTVQQLAGLIYKERQFDKMPLLGDALEEAGCDNAEVLQHCRGGGEHDRGCWVVDQVLGKE
jgi:hypothetical protein